MQSWVVLVYGENWQERQLRSCRFAPTRGSAACSKLTLPQGGRSLSPIYCQPFFVVFGLQFRELSNHDEAEATSLRQGQR
jgi:hypothetical protein